MDGTQFRAFCFFTSSEERGETNSILLYPLLSILQFCNLFITTFECHMMLKAQPPISSPAYMSSPLLDLIPKVSGVILAVIPECFIFDIAWYWIFLINARGLSYD